jgi:hypothetical protein
MRVFAVSDVHTDYKQNLEWLEGLCGTSEYRQDVILLAGDVSDSLETLERTFQLLVGAFKAVFFVPGNHELWCRKQERGTYDSLGGWPGLVGLLCWRPALLHQGFDHSWERQDAGARRLCFCHMVDNHFHCDDKGGWCPRPVPRRL